MINRGCNQAYKKPKRGLVLCHIYIQAIKQRRFGSLPIQGVECGGVNEGLLQVNGS